MDKVSGKLTVYFEEPFWVGVFEHIEGGKLSVAKVTYRITGNRYWNKIATGIESAAGTAKEKHKGH